MRVELKVNLECLIPWLSFVDHCDESERKATDLEKGVAELQSLLKQSAERYGALEDNFEREKREGKDELKRRNEAIRVLRKELDDANSLIKTLKNKGKKTNSVVFFLCLMFLSSQVSRRKASRNSLPPRPPRADCSSRTCP